MLNQNGWGGRWALWGLRGGRFPNFEIHPYDIWIPDLWRPSEAILSGSPRKEYIDKASRPQGLVVSFVWSDSLGCKVSQLLELAFCFDSFCVFTLFHWRDSPPDHCESKVGTPSGCDSYHERDDIWNRRDSSCDELDKWACCGKRWPRSGVGAGCGWRLVERAATFWCLEQSFQLKRLER